MLKNEQTKKQLLDTIPSLITAALIIIFGIVFEQKIIKILPTIFTIIILQLSSQGKRIAFIFGATNCLIYCFGYLEENLLASVGSSIFSFIIQMISFFQWKRNAYKNSTVFKRMTWKSIVLTIISFFVLWIAFYFLYIQLESSYIFLDNTIFVLNLIIPILVCFAFIEAQVINILCCFLTCILWCIIIPSNLSNITYLIMAAYSLFRVIQTLITWIKLYKEQNVK